MESARKKSAGDFVFGIAQLKKIDNGDLLCAHCDAEVQYVSAYLSHASKVPVDAYLRLNRNEEHARNCENSVRGKLEKLVADSIALEDVSSIFEILGDASYIFRMNMLVDAEKAARQLSTSHANDEISDKAARGYDYARTKRNLESYFRSASGIAKIRALIEGEDKGNAKYLTNKVKIKYKDRSVSWNSFYYDRSRYDVLFRRAARAKIPHPVAIKVTIKGDLKHSELATYCPWSLQCYSKTTDEGLVFVPRVNFPEENLAANMSTGTYIVVGKVWANKIKDKKSPFRNFSVSIFNQYQVKKEIETSGA